MKALILAALTVMPFQQADRTDPRALPAQLKVTPMIFNLRGFDEEFCAEDTLNPGTLDARDQALMLCRRLGYGAFTAFEIAPAAETKDRLWAFEFHNRILIHYRDCTRALTSLSCAK